MPTALRCNQFEKYKLALKTWEKRKGQCSPVPVIPQLASNEVGDGDDDGDDDCDDGDDHQGDDGDDDGDGDGDGRES